MGDMHRLSGVMTGVMPNSSKINQSPQHNSEGLLKEACS